MIFGETQIDMEFSSRLRKSIQLRRKARKHWVVRAPGRLAENAEFLQLCQEWARLQTRTLRRKSAQRKELAQIQSEIRKFLTTDDEGQQSYPRLPKKINPIGQQWNLESILDEVNQMYFDGQIQSLIGWGKGRASWHGKRIDSSGQLRDLILISPGYDRRNCPRYAIQGVVYHECLHIVCPPKKGRGSKRIVHSREFKLLEKKFLHYEDWRRWHETVMPGNLARKRR